jgi:hypothetical protein
LLADAAGDHRGLPHEEVMSQLLRRRAAAEYIREKWGVPCAYRTLAKLAVVGGGPLFVRYGRVPLYHGEDLDAWVRAKLSNKFKSTSEY